MKRRYFIGFLMLVFLLSDNLLAQKATEDTGNLFLWEFKSNEDTVYIFGSIHALKKEIYPLNSKIEKAFNSCNELALEIISDSLSPYDMITMINYADGSTLQENVTNENYKLIQKFAERYGYPETFYKRMRVWFLLMNFTMAELELSGYKAEFGIEAHFTKKANAKNMYISQLETPLSQLKYLQEFENATEEYLTYSLKNLKENSKSLDTLALAWLNGADEAVLDMISGIEDAYPEVKKINEKIIYERNEKMASSIEKLIEKKKNCFIIVGAGHLIGQRSIIELLEKKGYKFNRIRK